jgi:hypothetical protein
MSTDVSYAEYLKHEALRDECRDYLEDMGA